MSDFGRYKGRGRGRRGTPSCKVQVPWDDDGAFHDVLVCWSFTPDDDDEIEKSLRCITAYLQDPPVEDRYLRSYKPTTCIVKSNSGHTTNTETVTGSNSFGTAYHSADPFPHQTVKFSTDEHRDQGKAFTVHIYTDASGSYDRRREATWTNLKNYNRSDIQALESSQDMSAITENHTSSKVGSSKAGSSKASSSKASSSKASSKRHAANPSYSGDDLGMQATPSVQSWPDGWYMDPWSSGMRWMENGMWTGYTK